MLKSKGHDVRLISPRPRKYSEEPPEDVLFVGRSAKWNTPISTTLELGASFNVDDLEDILANECFDIIHIHEPEVPVLGAQVLARATCPKVATFHAIHPESVAARAIETIRVPYARNIFPMIDRATAVSDVAAEFVRRNSDLIVEIIPNGVDLNVYKKPKTVNESSTKSIVYVGRLEKRKGVKHLLAAYASMRSTRSDVELILAGDGPQRLQLEALCENNQIPDVSFLGFVSLEKKIELMQNCAIFCSPAIYGESFGIVLLEALACGAVVIAGNNPGYSGVMQGTGALGLVTPEDTLDFANRMGLLMNDDNIRKVFKTWADGYVTNFTYEKIVDRYLDIYNQALDK